MAESTQLTIPAPNFRTVSFNIVGDAPLVCNKFSRKARDELAKTMEAGSTARKGKKREPKDFDADFKGATHRSVEGWAGVPAPAFRNAMISACKTTGFFMSRAKLSVFVLADGIDEDDGTPMIRITSGEPQKAMHYARNETGVIDLRARPMWPAGWRATVRVRFDADQFTLDDVANLLARAGMQVGIGAGRPDSKKSNGLGWGLFHIEENDNGDSR